MQRAFHMYVFTLKFLLLAYMIKPSIFVVDKYRSRSLSAHTSSDQPCRSTSMTRTDRQPLANTPMARRIVRQHNNRYGAVLSALWSFWHSRQVATRNGGHSGARQDIYSIVLFGSTAEVKEPRATATRSIPDSPFRSLLRTTPPALRISWSDFF